MRRHRDTGDLTLESDPQMKWSRVPSHSDAAYSLYGDVLWLYRAGRGLRVLRPIGVWPYGDQARFATAVLDAETYDDDWCDLAEVLKGLALLRSGDD
jgi:hypothetical protein